MSLLEHTHITAKVVTVRNTQTAHRPKLPAGNRCQAACWSSMMLSAESWHSKVIPVLLFFKHKSRKCQLVLHFPHQMASRLHSAKVCLKTSSGWLSSCLYSKHSDDLPEANKPAANPHRVEMSRLQGKSKHKNLSCVTKDIEPCWSFKAI